MNTCISIITDDSQTIFPDINKWKGMGRGKSIGELRKLTREVLSENDLDFPTNDLELEVKYKEVLEKYVRSARLMFTGSFSEVRSFHEMIEKLGDVNLYIVSGRYGIVNHETDIIPYDSVLRDNFSIKVIDTKTNFSQKVKTVASQSDILILLLPKQIIEYLIEIKALETERKLKIAVCSKSAASRMEKLGFQVFIRPGVTRIGIENREKIIGLIENYFLSIL